MGTIRQVFIPPPSADKAIGEAFPEGFAPSNWLESIFGRPKLPVQSIGRSVYFTWTTPILFIAVDPVVSFMWLNLNDDPVNVEWVFKYQYLNKESWLGYFDEAGMPIMTYNDGRSEINTVIFKATKAAEKDIIQATPSHIFNKTDRRSGTVVVMELQAHPALDEIYFMGAQIQFQEYPRVREPKGRKRTRKKRWYDDEPYPYDES